MTPETHLVVVWEAAASALDRILADATRRFTVNDVVRVTWTPSLFARNLSRLYGTALPSGSTKERECGTGPFVAIVVTDEHPRHVARRRGASWESANGALLAAKRRYRRWATGSFAVHTTLTPAEATRDVRLLLGRSLDDLARERWSGEVVARERDLLGDPGWESFAELCTGLDATVRARVTPAAGAEPGTILTDDPWWAARIADPRIADATDGPTGDQTCEPSVAGERMRFVVLDAAAHGRLAELPPARSTATTPSVRDRAAAVLRLRA